ncbi:hypothetical protein OROGR_000737 [Orobanche gracilis]
MTGGFIDSHKKKRAKQVKKLIQRGLPRRFPTNSR